MRKRWRKVVMHAAAWGPVLAAVACSRQDVEEDAVIGSARSAIVAAPRFIGPAGQAIGNVLVFGTERVHLYDRVQIGVTGAHVAVLGAGWAQQSDIAAGVRMNGSVWIGGNAFLGSQAVITGDLRVRRRLDRQAGAIVQGATIVPAMFTTTAHSWQVSTPPPPRISSSRPEPRLLSPPDPTESWTCSRGPSSTSHRAPTISAA